MTSEDEQQAGRCLNCGAELHGEYCHVCGQRDLDPRASIWELLGEFLRETFELDGRLPRTLVPFLFKPGTLEREFMAGRRRRYTSPVRLYVFAALVSFFLLQQGAAHFVSGEDLTVTRNGLEIHSADDPTPGLAGAEVEVEDPAAPVIERDSEVEELSRYAGLDREALARTLVGDFFGWAPLGAIALITLYAGLLQLFHWQVPFLTHLVASTHVHAFALLVFGGATLFGSGVALLVALGLTQVYVLTSLIRTYERPIGRTIPRWIFLNLIYWIIALLVFVAVFVAATQLDF